MSSNGQYSASDYQHTLKDSITIIGRGLHLGLQVIMTLMPADANSGYVFMRRDVAPLRGEVPARWNTVVDARLSTTVGNAFGTRVGTIEHLLAALWVCGVHNARIVLDAPEVPIMDGSAAPFVDLLNKVELERQTALIQALVIDKPLVVSEPNKHASLVPADEFSVDMSIDFDNSVIGRQSMEIKVDKEIFSQQLAPARTFGFQEQLYTLHKLGLARGGSLNNAVLIQDNGVINEEGLRFEDEFVRHKIVDLLGDISLLGACIIGKFIGSRSGHQLNHQLMRTLMINADCWHSVPLAEHRRQNNICNGVRRILKEPDGNQLNAGRTVLGASLARIAHRIDNQLFDSKDGWAMFRSPIFLPGNGEGLDVGVGLHRLDDALLVAEARILHATER